MNSLKVYIKSVIAITLWGFSFLWSNQLLQLGIPMEFFVFVRILLAGLILLAINKIVGNDIRIRRKDLFGFVMLAMCEPFIYFICETYGIKFTESPTYSSLMIATTPIFSILAGVLIFREKFSLVNLFGVIVCLGGLVMVTLTASSIGQYFLLGLLLLLIAVFAEVGHASFTKSLSSGYPPFVIVMYQFLIGSVMFLPMFLSKGLRSFDVSVYLSWDVLSPILCLAVLCSVIAFSFWADSIKNLGVAKSSVFQAMNPVVTAIAGTLIGQESLRPLQWIGIVIAVVGVVLTQLGAKVRLSRK